MATLAEIREQYPQYSDLSDAALADALYGKFYSDISRKEFDAKLGLKTGPSRPPLGGIAGALGMGVEAPISSARTGIESLFGGNAAVEAGLSRKAKLGEKYAEQPGFEQVKKAYEERGIFPAVVSCVQTLAARLLLSCGQRQLVRAPGPLCQQAPCPQVYRGNPTGTGLLVLV